jgi:hypothetical protein
MGLGRGVIVWGFRVGGWLIFVGRLGVGWGLVGWWVAVAAGDFGEDGGGDEGGAGFVGVAEAVDGFVDGGEEFDADGFFALVVGESGSAAAAVGWGHGDLG